MLFLDCILQIGTESQCSTWYCAKDLAGLKNKQTATNKAKLCRNALSDLKVFVALLSFEKCACPEGTATVMLSGGCCRTRWVRPVQLAQSTS